jgi:hypothetical protein
MNFINPFELLDVSEVDAASIRKAKRRKLTEFDLSDDGTIEFGNRKITKSDFIRVTDELDNSEKAEFYLFLSNSPKLNAFLTHGDTSVFSNFRQESIFSDAGFINFISPYFAEQYNKVLLEAYQNEDIGLVKRIVANPPLVNGKDTEKAYSGLSKFLKNVEAELHEIRTEIDNEESYYDEDTVEELVDDLSSKVYANHINALPNYFQAQRNEIAQKVRNISVAVFNSINNADVAFQIISYSLEFSTNNLTKQKLQKDYEQIKEIYESRQESEQFSPELAKYAGALLQIVQLIKQVENNQIETSSITTKVNSLFSLLDLNQLPSVFDEIREQIALAIRGLSVAVWNEKSDIDIALGLIQVAQKISLKAEVKSQINKAFNELSGLRDRQAESIIETLKGINKGIREVYGLTPTAKTIKLIEMLDTLRTTGMSGQTINTGKVQEVLNGIFEGKVIQALKSINPTTKENIFDELNSILAILPEQYVNNFIDRLVPICGENADLITKVQNMKKTIPSSSTTPSSQASAPSRPIVSSPNTSSNPGCISGKSLAGLTILGLLLLHELCTGKCKNTNLNNSTPISSYSNQPKYVPPSNPYPNPAAPVYDPPPKPIEVSKYKGKQLANGASPFSACFGNGRFGGNAWLVFKNSNTSDAIVCLVNVSSGKTVRNEYIRAGSRYKMESIPSGTYYLKVFYGNDWNPTLKNVCGTKGSFETDVHFSKSEGRSDWIEVQNNYDSYSTGEITLYTVANGNMSQSPISEESFFNN